MIYILVITKGLLAAMRDNGDPLEPPKKLVAYVNGFRHTFDLYDQILILYPVVGSNFEGLYTVKYYISERKIIWFPLLCVGSPHSFVMPV